MYTSTRALWGPYTLGDGSASAVFPRELLSSRPLFYPSRNHTAQRLMEVKPFGLAPLQLIFFEPRRKYLSTMDLLVPATMKNAAKRDM